uniref:At1g61320/AtMIF1 LRR domain-containing protein n=1 Tax=Nelumbo nucifera TaxID=4432 RepID=A0A822Z2H2_NELNU|nr:TPA_asm: hypothetical protein HUJ06_013310 [Nelumbo nucifera]
MDSIVMNVGNSPNPILAFPEITCLDFEETMFIDSQSSPPPGITPLRWLMFVRNQGRRRFITFVHQILLHYKGEKISRFRLRFCFSTEHFDHVNRWIEFAITKQAQELDLDFSGSGLAQDSRTGYCPYELPHYVFSCSSCNVLKLNFCKFHPSIFRIFSSLKMLTLKRLELSSELLSQVLNNCLVLEILHLEMCHGLCYLKILSSNLRLEKLTIRDCRPLTQGIEICSPNLKSLSYFGGVVLFRLEKMLSLHEVVLDFGLQTVLHESDHHKFIRNLLTDLDHAAVMSSGVYLLNMDFRKFRVFLRLQEMVSFQWIDLALFGW